MEISVTNRRMERTRTEEDTSAKPASAKKKDAERRMDLDAYAEAAGSNRTKPTFGAFAEAQPPSMDAQINRAIGDARAEGARMHQLLGAASKANQSVSTVSRGAEVITGAASSIATVPNLVGAAVESAVRQDTKPLERAAQDAAQSMAWVIDGALTGKIDNARGIYRQFERQYSEYVQVNRDYQAALRSQDHDAVGRLGSRKQELVGQIKETVDRLQTAVLDVGREDKQFEKATVHAAKHLAVSAAFLGAGAAAHGFGAPVTASHAAKDLALETAASQGPERALGSH